VGAGSWITAVRLFHSPHDKDANGRHRFLFALQFQFSDGRLSALLGNENGQRVGDEELFTAASGCMITALQFRDHDVNEYDGATVTGICQAMAVPLVPSMAEEHAAVQLWSRYCSFYPRPSKWFTGTVAFELVYFPGHFLLASNELYEYSLLHSGGLLNPPSAGSPHLTIERLEGVRRKDCQDSATTTLLSLPMEERTFRRASFTMSTTADGAFFGGNIAGGSNAGEGVGTGDTDDSDEGAAAEEIAHTLRMWRERGVLLLDEVDLLLQPLKSELNFPIGKKVEIDVDVETDGAAGYVAVGASSTALPKGLRWDLPMAILDAVLVAGRILSKIGAPTTSGQSHFVQDLVVCFRRGKREKQIQTIPHLVLLEGQDDSDDGKETMVHELQRLVANFTIGWIESHLLVRWKHGFADRQPPAVSSEEGALARERTF
jgi:hypothetical protein